jgi:peptide deformylase
MAIRKILTLGGPREKILRAKAKKVTRFDTYLERLVDDMWETMRAAPGVGLAAPQIGESIRVLVAAYEDEQVALVNPEILKAEGEELGTEGCLSIPGLVGDNVPRAASISVKGRDPRGKEIRLRAEGWWARILQHEIDHLDGVLYIDHIKPQDIREVTEDDVAEEGAPSPSSPSSPSSTSATRASGTAAKAAEKTARGAEATTPAGGGHG